MRLLDALGLVPDATRPEVVALVGGGGKSSVLFRLGQEIVAQGGRALLTCTTHLSHEQIAEATGLVVVQADGLPLAQIAATLDAHGQCLLVGPPGGPRRPGLTSAQVDTLAAQATALGVTAIVVEADGSRQLPLKAPADHEPVLPGTTTLLVPVMGIEAVGQRLSAGLIHRPERVAALLELDPTTDARITPAQAAALALHELGGAKALPAGARLVPLINKVERADQLATARLIASRWAVQGVRSVITALGAEPPRVRERWAPWAVIILAAGASRRLGTPKQLLPVAGEPLVRRAARTALASGASQVVVVTGAVADAVQAALADVVARAEGRLAVVHNPAWETGQASSMHAGLAALSDPIAAAVFLPVDQPDVPVALLRHLAAAWRTGAALAAPEVAGELRGAPALFDRAYWPALMQVRGDVGGRIVLREHASTVQTVPVAATILRDVDTPADWAGWAG